MSTRSSRTLIIGLAGKVGSGKSTVANFLSRQFGFEIVRTREVLSKIIEDGGGAVTESALQELGARLVDERGPQAVSEVVASSLRPGRQYVIDALRFTNEAAIFNERPGHEFKLIYLATPEHLRLERFLTRLEGRDSDKDSFYARSNHAVEQDVPNFLEYADLILGNSDIESTAAQVSSFILQLKQKKRPTAISEMIESVAEFHRKHGFDIGTRDTKVMQYRMGLMLEELGEINECISKGRGDIREEHADLLILLLGNCITMKIDIESAFWKKYEKIMLRPAKKVGETIRVSHWRGNRVSTPSRHGYYHVDLKRLINGDDEFETEESTPAQLSLFVE